MLDTQIQQLTTDTTNLIERIYNNRSTIAKIKNHASSLSESLDNLNRRMKRLLNEMNDQYFGNYSITGRSFEQEDVIVENDGEPVGSYKDSKHILKWIMECNGQSQDELIKLVAGSHDPSLFEWKIVSLNYGEGEEF